MLQSKFCVSLQPNVPANDVFGTDVAIIKHYSNLGNVYLISGDMSSLILNDAVDFFIPNETKITYHWGKTRLTTHILPLPDKFIPLYTGQDTTCYVIDDFESLHGDGVIAVIQDVSPNTIIQQINISESTIDCILSCFDEIMEHHSKTEDETKVVNLSWTTLRHPFLDDIVYMMSKRNLLFVCAAGNSGTDVSLYFPAGSDNVMTVGCTDEYDRVVPFGDVVCNYGEDVDIFAPGVDIDNNTGTSLACAITTSAALHYIEDNRSLTSQQLKQHIIDTAKKDILYMDREIYSSSPNLLLQIPT